LAEHAAEEFLRLVLGDASLGRAVKQPSDPGVYVVEDVQANPQVGAFAAATVVLDDGRRARVTVMILGG
jgi:hypothetical protein